MRNLRKRPTIEDEDEDKESSMILTKKRSIKNSTNDSKNNVTTLDRLDLFQYESSKTIQVDSDSKATSICETEGFRQQKTEFGPKRRSAYIRVTSLYDYQPDICKDYKETGYCGYGDSCKFMHDRGDYKSGWQIDKEYELEQATAKARKTVLDSDDFDSESSALPLACQICKLPFVNPVVTKCKHYFCERCALKVARKSKRCYVCNHPTLGIFNVAHEIHKSMASNNPRN